MESKSTVKESMINTVKQTIECLETSLASDILIKSVFDMMMLASATSGEKEADSFIRLLNELVTTIRTGEAAKNEALKANRTLLQIFEL